MTQSAAHSDVGRVLDRLEPPLLVVSTVVGRGMHALGEAVVERYGDRGPAHHVAIEELLGGRHRREDYDRYRWIAGHAPALLWLVYTCPIFYYRKLARERFFATADLSPLETEIAKLNARTVLCVSHRPMFWTASLKRRRRLPIALWGLVGEYGPSLGWRYQFWDQIDGLMSPVGNPAAGTTVPAHVDLQLVDLPARDGYRALAELPGDPDAVLLVCGFWGQGPIVRTIAALRAAWPPLRIHAVCGENGVAERLARQRFRDDRSVHVYGAVPSLLPLLRQCGSVITKPGIATLVEAHAARRQLMLLKGMPVAEDNNARYAVAEFGARWFDVATWRAWRASHAVTPVGSR